MPTDYKKGQIYKLWTLESDEIYIGSTTQPLYKRLSKHKAPSNTCNSKLLFERYKDVMIELIEDFPCENKKELNKREGYYQRLNKEFIINNNIAARTWSEYYIDNKEKYNESSKQYYIDNKEKYNERSKQNYIDNKEKYNELSKQNYIDNKEKYNESSKQYRIDNKDKVKEYNKQYYIDNKLNYDINKK